MLTEATKLNLLLKLLGVSDDVEATNTQKGQQVGDSLIGQICMFRTYSAGVHFGKLEERNGKECLVSNSRRVFYWEKACSLSQLAVDGSGDLDKCKIAMQLNSLLLTEVIEIIPMESKAIENLYGCPVWKK